MISRIIKGHINNQTINKNITIDHFIYKLRTKLYFHVNSSRKYSIVLIPNMAALSCGCKPRIQSNYTTEKGKGLIEIHGTGRGEDNNDKLNAQCWRISWIMKNYKLGAIYITNLSVLSSRQEEWQRPLHSLQSSQQDLDVQSPSVCL